MCKGIYAQYAFYNVCIAKYYETKDTNNDKTVFSERRYKLIVVATWCYGA